MKIEFKDAAMSYEIAQLGTSSDKSTYYEQFEIDLDKFPELEGEVGDTLTLVIKAKVCDKRLSENRNCQHVKVVSLGACEYDKEESNQADEAYNRLTKNGRS